MSKERSPRAVCSTTIGTSGMGPPFRGSTTPLTLSRWAPWRRPSRQILRRLLELSEVIVSLHIARVGPREAAEVLLRAPKPGRVPGLTYAATTTTAALGEPLLPPKQLGQVGMIAAWDS